MESERECMDQKQTEGKDKEVRQRLEGRWETGKVRTGRTGEIRESEGRNKNLTSCRSFLPNTRMCCCNATKGKNKILTSSVTKGG